MEDKLSWIDRNITLQTKAYKDFVKEMENTPTERWTMDGEREFSQQEKKFLQIYNSKQEKVRTEYKYDVTSLQDQVPKTLNSFGDLRNTVEFVEKMGFSNNKSYVFTDLQNNTQRTISSETNKQSFLADLWAKELKKQTDLSFGMTKTQIDEKQASHYREFQSKLNNDLQKNEEKRIGNRLEEEYKDTSEGFSFDDVLEIDIISTKEQVNLSEKQKEILLRDGFIRIADDRNEDELKVSLSINKDGNINGTWNTGEKFILKKEEIFPELKLEKHINNQKPNSMEEQKTFDQVQYLKDQLKYLGFGEGEKLHKDLEAGINSPEKSFEIKTTSDKTLPENKVDFNIKFNKSEKGGVFLNSYSATLSNNKDENVSQNFTVNKENAFTAKEAVNLLEGRSVKIEFDNPKTAQKETAFVKLNFAEEKNKYGNYNFQTFHQNYGVDAKQIVEKSNLIFDKPEYKDSVIKSLEKGNVVKVKFELEDKIIEGKAVLNPQYKNLNLYDSEMNRLNTNKPLQGMDNDNKHEKSNVREQSMSRGI